MTACSHTPTTRSGTHSHAICQFDKPPRQPTCSFKVSTKLETFSNAAFGVHRKSSLDVIHFDPSGGVWTLPEQTIYKNLWRYVSETVLQNVIKNASPVGKCT